MQEKLDRAWELKNLGNHNDALRLYMEVRDQLQDEAWKRAREVPGAVTENGDVRRLTIKLSDIDTFLKENMLFCTVLNNIGVIYAEVGDKESAKSCFEESIKYSPESVEYSNPKIGLKELSL